MSSQAGFSIAYMLFIGKNMSGITGESLVGARQRASRGTWQHGPPVRAHTLPHRLVFAA